ncbi:MAG: hypothetical protein FJZ00_02725 [Candidatus Sericytochromatia bacterium]|uniref:Uncharacterized protein n=1 Tax=Candidatus Tanganyikabacteria bacterium TaxID=2961651 RepID=A0A938BKB1_9BACT|nr:hypothetical protein [Candidatus Tanganyikabacteria bacterium]
MPDEIQPTDWFAGLDFATDTFTGADGASVRSTRRAGAAPEADLLDRQTVPQSEAAYRRQLSDVFGSGEAAVTADLGASPELAGLLKSWPARGSRQTGERIFTLVSEGMGRAFGFTPAHLAWSRGLPADNAIGLFLRGAGWEKVVISALLLNRPVREFLDTVVHEQTHRLQHALTCRLNTPQIPLDPQVRGLVLYWLRKEPDRKRDYQAAARIRDPRERLAFYRSIPIEFHAYGAAERLVHTLLP